jgi:hypothetical protein
MFQADLLPIIRRINWPAIQNSLLPINKVCQGEEFNIHCSLVKAFTNHQKAKRYSIAFGTEVQHGFGHRGTVRL